MFIMKAILFDMDGVIVDTMGMHHEATIRSLSGSGVRVSREELKKFDTMRSSDAFRQLLSSKTEGEIEDLIAKKYEYLRKRASGIKPFRGFLDFFFKVKGRYPLAVVSSSRRGFIEFILSQIGELEAFECIVGAEDVSRGKPHPEGFLKAASLLGVGPLECLVIEDSIFGIKSAKAAGAKCIAVTTTYDRSFLLDADLVVDSLSEVSIERAEGLFGA